MATIRIKFYDSEHKLHSVVGFTSVIQAMQYAKDIQTAYNLSTVYITDGKRSFDITFIQQQKQERPIYYTRPDKVVVKTLSIHPSHYPMLAHYSDRHTERITLGLSYRPQEATFQL